MIAQESFYIQYHNADKLKYFPTDKTDFNSLVSDITLDDSKVDTDWIYTSKKKTVEKSIGSRCFLIVGKTENKIKNYYLWCHFEIEDYEDDSYEVVVMGNGQNLKHPILLNNLPEFDSFKKFCGNFGIGFQNISNHDFSRALYSHIKDETKFLQPNLKVLLIKEIQELHGKMMTIKPERKVQEMEKIVRNDRKIVTLLKELVNYKCQFPSCNSHIPDKNGINYVEVAHITPVSKGGQSILGNLIVFCPNHHKEFDLGVKEILEDNTKILSGILNGVNFKIDLNNNYTYNMEE